MHDYAVFTLIASYWYRKAYPTLTHMKRDMTPRERIALKLAEHYDNLAVKFLNSSLSIESYHRLISEVSEQYRNLYTIWRDNGFSDSMFASFTSSHRSICALPIESTPSIDYDSHLAAQESEFWSNYDSEQDEREIQQFYDENGFEPS